LENNNLEPITNQTRKQGSAFNEYGRIKFTLINCGNKSVEERLVRRKVKITRSVANTFFLGCITYQIATPATAIIYVGLSADELKITTPIKAKAR
jgi:hypothetical protein